MQASPNRTIPIANEPLTIDQVKALRMANTVCFFHNPFGSKEEGQTNAGMIRVSQKVKAPYGYRYKPMNRSLGPYNLDPSGLITLP